MLKLIECPRDAIQGFHKAISTAEKIEYMNLLLKVGFDTLDFGSFVSPKAIPQMADTQEVLAALDWKNSKTKLLAIVANQRGAEQACAQEGVKYLGYPFSISETFQLRNTNKTIAESLVLVKDMQDLCQNTGKELVVYISMGFGNPYGDDWSVEIAANRVQEIADLGVKIISLADTVGSAEAESIAFLFQKLIPQFPDIEFGAHFHALPEARKDKLKAAFDSGCRRFDAAMQGIGGCPFAKEELVGNIATETLYEFAIENDVDLGLDTNFFVESSAFAAKLFL